MRSRFSRRKPLFEVSAAAVVAAATAQTNANNNSQNQNNNNQQITGEYDENQPLFKAEDVEKMSPGDILNYVYVNVPKNIDPQTKQALLARADQMRKDADVGKDTEQRAKEILRAIGSSIKL